MASGIRALLDTVVQALPQVGNLGLLFFLLFFIFSALGVELFGRMACDDQHPCEGLGEHANFVNFGMAFLTLFRVATGDNWNGIMKVCRIRFMCSSDCMLSDREKNCILLIFVFATFQDTLRENCDATPDCFRNCCVSRLAPLFFVVFVLMAQFVLVNVVVAVLMKHLEESHKQMEDDLDIEAEIEAEFAAQEEIMANLEDAVEEEPEDLTQVQLAKEVRVSKVVSLPDNFLFTYFSDESNKND